MKKIILVILVLVFVLTGCKTNNRINSEEERAQKYNSYVLAIETNTENKEKSSFFSISVAMNKLDDGKYRYDVIIDNPVVAMYDVEVLCIPMDVTGTLMINDMCPSAGILEDSTYNLIPNQVNIDKGFPKGITVSGITDLDTVNLELLVVWTGFAKLAENREFFSLSATYAETENK